MSMSGIRAQLLQTEEEWAARNAILSRQLADLIDEYSAPGATDGIEVGCQHGALTEQMGRLTCVKNWTGIDPALTEKTVTDRGCILHPARASRLEFPDGTFDVALFANVFEHIPPERARRQPSRDLPGAQAGRHRRRAAPEPLLPDRVPQSAPVHGLAADQVAAPVLEAGAGQLGARLLRRYDQAPQADSAARGLRRGPRPELQLPARSDPKQGEVGRPPAGTTDAIHAVVLAVRTRPACLTSRARMRRSSRGAIRCGSCAPAGSPIPTPGARAPMHTMLVSQRPNRRPIDR